MDARTASAAQAAPSTASLRRRIRLAATAGWVLFGLAYLLIFSLFNSAGMGPAFQRALINVLPAALLAYPAARITETYLLGARPWVAALGHLALALAFANLWYIGVQVGYGIQRGDWLTGGLAGRPLLGLALSWQAFQGVTLYAVVALFAYAAAFRLRISGLEREIAALREAKGTPRPVPRQVLVRDGRALRPVAVDDILALSGAGDYVEVHTRTGTHLSTTTLSDFEAELPAGFARVHRSHIVRMDAVLEIESAGNGRLTLHLPTGLSVTTSRAGARLVRESAV